MPKTLGPLFAGQPPLLEPLVHESKGVLCSKEEGTENGFGNQLDYREDPRVGGEKGHPMREVESKTSSNKRKRVKPWGWRRR